MVAEGDGVFDSIEAEDNATEGAEWGESVEAMGGVCGEKGVKVAEGGLREDGLI